MTCCLKRAHEHLLARVSVQVAVEVAVAGEIERLLPVQLLVAGLQVDHCVVLAAVGVVVEVAVVDVHPDPADLGDELLEAAEVDHDQVVDLDPGELLHRLERPLGPAARVGLVDPVAEGRLARAMDLDVQVAREREHRDRVRRGVGAHEHERVRAGRIPELDVLEPAVVADHERGRGLVRRRHLVELLLRDLHLRRGGVELLHARVQVEVVTACQPQRDHERGGREREEDLADEPQRAPLGLAIAGHLGDDARRENGMAVPVQLGSTADSFLQRRPHSGPENARNAPRALAEQAG